MSSSSSESSEWADLSEDDQTNWTLIDHLRLAMTDINHLRQAFQIITNGRLTALTRPELAGLPRLEATPVQYVLYDSLINLQEKCSDFF